MLLPFIEDALRRAIGDPDAQGCEARSKTAFGSVAPADFPPDRLRENGFGRA